MFATEFFFMSSAGFYPISHDALLHRGITSSPHQTWFSLGPWIAVKQVFNLQNDQRMVSFLQDHGLVVICLNCPPNVNAPVCQDRTHQRNIWGFCKLV